MNPNPPLQAYFGRSRRLGGSGEAAGPGGRGDLSAEGMLRNRKGVCAGYASLLEALLAIAGVESKQVGGYSRSFGFDASEEGRLRAPDSNHAWSAVKLSHGWALLDATWMAGHVEPGSRGFTQEYHGGWAGWWLVRHSRGFVCGSTMAS